MRPGSGRAHHAQRSLSRHGDRLPEGPNRDRKSTRLNSSHLVISYAVFCLKKKKTYRPPHTSPPCNGQTRKTYHSSPEGPYCPTTSSDSTRARSITASRRTRQPTRHNRSA